jgi:hypothetical protein
MEDTHSIVLDMGDKGTACFGVYDGHYGNSLTPAIQGQYCVGKERQ